MMTMTPRSAAAALQQAAATAAAMHRVWSGATAVMPVRYDGFGRVACDISAQKLGALHMTRLSAINADKKASLLSISVQTRRLLRILGGDVSQKDQSKCHS